MEFCPHFDQFVRNVHKHYSDLSLALHFLQNSTPFWCKNHFCSSKTVEVMFLWTPILLHCALQDMTFDHPDIRHIMINLYRWTSLVVWLLEGIVLHVRIFGHIFFRKSRNLYLRPPVGGRPLSHIQEAAWRYGYTEMLVQNQEPIRTQYFKWSQNYESDPRYHY